MRRSLQLVVLGFFLLSALIGSLVGWASFEWITRALIEREVDNAHAAIRTKFRTFDILLEREEMEIEERMAEALPYIVEALLRDPPAFLKKSEGELAELSRRAGVDNLYIIDRDTRVVATDFAADRGFELGSIGPGLRQFLTRLIGSGEFVADRINMSSRTGLLVKYGYLSPKGSDYIAEVSIDLRKFLARERSPAFADFLFGAFFQELVETEELLQAIDIHMVNAVSRFSLFDQNTRLPEAIVERLRREDRIVEQSGNRWTVYSKLSPVGSRLSTADFLAVTTTFDFSGIADRLLRFIAILVGVLLLVSALAYLLAARLTTRRVVERIEAIRGGLATITEGDYGHALAVGGKDELKDIVDDINRMRARIAEDIERREADARKLARAIEEAQRAREAAETASRAKSAFLSNMSHELRTPLNAILGFGQILDRDTANPLTPDQQTAIRHILSSGDHLLALIDQVLDLARIESGKLDVTFEPVDPDAVIDECLAMSKALVRRHDVTLRRERLEGDSLPAVRADRTRLQQVLLNILSNAAKYNRPGGSVVVSAGPTQAGRLRVAVADTGRGIPRHYHDRVFTPFERLGARGSRTEGTGIGLSIARQLVELMGGAIGFTSVEGEGSTFWFELPLVGAEARPAAVAPSTLPAGAEADPAELPSGKVLYIEDSATNLQLMRMILGRAPGIELQSVHAAELGIEIARTRPPDLILMDIDLPGMDGIQALRVLRADPRTRTIPVIAVSANAMESDLARAGEAGFDAYITKPFDIAAAMATIGRVLGLARDEGRRAEGLS